MLAMMIWMALAIQPPPSDQPPAEDVYATPEAIEAEMRAYAAWVVAVGAIQAPVEEHVEGFISVWRGLDWRGDFTPAIREFRTRLPQLRAEIERTNARLAAVEPPSAAMEFAPEDLRPAAYLRDLMASNREIEAGLAAALPFLERGQNGSIGEFDRAGRNMLRTHLAIGNARIARRRAQRLTAERGSVIWAISGFQILQLEVERAMLERSIARPTMPPPNGLPRLAEDAEQLVRDLEEIAVPAHAAQIERLAEAEAAGNGAGIRVERLVLVEARALQEVLPAMRQFAAGLREASGADWTEDDGSAAEGALSQKTEEAIRQINSILRNADMETQRLLGREA